MGLDFENLYGRNTIGNTEYEDEKLLYYTYCDIDDKPHSANNASSITNHICSQYKTIIIKKGLSKIQEVV
jgi:hypothetical protein